VITVEQLLQAAESLGTLPRSLPRLIEYLEQADLEPEPLVATAMSDPSLAANLMRRANAADKGAVVPVKDVSVAVMRLGTAQSLALMVAAALRGQIDRPLRAYGMAAGDLWGFSLTAAQAADELRKLTATKVEGTAVTAALLQDIGKLALNELIDPLQVVEIRSIRATDQLSLERAEQLVLGIENTTAAGVLASNWGFPEPICTALSARAEPDEVELPICDLVHLSGIITRMHADKRSASRIAQDCRMGTLMRLGLDGGKLLEALKAIEGAGAGGSREAA
jgi:HD-like signal output (HDOD) protein